MNEFKFGDRVKVVCKERYYYGKEGVVKGEIKIGTDFIYFVVLQNQDTCFYFTEELEKVEEDVTQEYEVGKPYLWFGGECPVPYGTSVSIRFGTKNFDYIEEGWTYTENAHNINWQHDYEDENIVMFKVVEYPKQTRKVELELSEEEITTIKEVLGKVNL